MYVFLHRDRKFWRIRLRYFLLLSHAAKLICALRIIYTQKWRQCESTKESPMLNLHPVQPATHQRDCRVNDILISLSECFVLNRSFLAVSTFRLHHIQQLLILLKHHLLQHNFTPAGQIMQTLVHASDILPDTCRNVCHVDLVKSPVSEILRVCCFECTGWTSSITAR